LLCILFIFLSDFIPLDFLGKFFSEEETKFSWSFELGFGLIFQVELSKREAWPVSGRPIRTLDFVRPCLKSPDKNGLQNQGPSPGSVRALGLSGRPDF
jgi:hypothetical protein